MAIKQEIVSIKPDKEIDTLLFVTLQDMGAIIPTTIDAVTEMEKLLKSEMNDFPEELNDHQAVLLRGKGVLNRPTFFLTQRDIDTEIEMARAAREGKGISFEIEELMKADREKAENNQ
jgi:hypothetical protein